MNKLLLLYSFFIFTNLSAQVIEEDWDYRIYGSQFTDEVISRPHPAGVFVSTEIDYNIVNYLLDYDGNLLWSSTIDDVEAFYLIDVEVDPVTNNSYVLLNTFGSDLTTGTVNFIILKYSSQGVLIDTLISNHTDSNHQNESDRATDMTIDENGNIYVAFFHYHGACNTADSRAVISKYNSAFFNQWSYETIFAVREVGSVCISSTEKVYFSYRIGAQAKVECLNSLTGNLIQEVDVLQPLTNNSGPFTLSADNFGNIYGICNYYVDYPNLSSYQQSPRVIKIDNAASLVWSDTLRIGQYWFDTEPKGLVVDDIGDIYVGYKGWGGPSISLAKIDKNGVKLWRRTHPNEEGSDLAITDNSEIVLASCNYATSPTSSKIRKYDQSGNLIWSPEPYILSTDIKSNGSLAISHINDIFFSGNSIGEVFTFGYNDVPLFVRSFQESSKISIYPNPCESNLNIKITDGKIGASYIEVVSTLGNVLLRKEISSGDMKTINVVEIPAGFYVLCIYNQERNLLARESFIRN